MSGFNTKNKNNNGEYEVTFYTDNYEDYKTVENLCRHLIGHDKPQEDWWLCGKCELYEDSNYCQYAGLCTLGIRECHYFRRINNE